MGGNEELSAELKSLEAELAALVPEDRRLDHSRLWFAAGQASLRRRAGVAARAWAAALAAMSIVAAALAVALVIRPEPPVKIVERIIRMPAETKNQVASDHPAEAGVPRPKPGVPGPKRSGGPADPTLADADGGLPPAYGPRYSTPEPTSVLAAVFFGVPNEVAGPIRRTGVRWGLRDWDLTEDYNSRPEPAARGQSTIPKPPEPKTYRELLDELTKHHG